MSKNETSIKKPPSSEERDRRQAGKGKASNPILAPGRFSLVCESLDGKLCLFEDADGHYTVVRTSRLV